MKILLKSVLTRFKALLGGVPLIATTYTIGTLVQPRVSFAISHDRDNLSLVNTLQLSTQNISQQSYNVNKNNLESKHRNYFILSQNQEINTSQNSQLKNNYNVVGTKYQGANFSHQWKTTKTNKFGIPEVNNLQLPTPVNAIVVRRQPVAPTPVNAIVVRRQPVAPTPVNAIVVRRQPVAPIPVNAIVVRRQPVAPTPVNAIVVRRQPMVTNIPPQPVAPTPVNAVVVRRQPMVANIPPQPVAPTPVNPMIPRPQPTIENLHPVPSVPQPQPIVKNTYHKQSAPQHSHK
ncbi:MAG: hypothetical protein F6K40_01515 [Okeania sp. SIO3I5]|uniref:hypothetical protein n=1 Tax=Okeania sp. SIO3I5 TaxID=2607805 RepID=UPI0013BA0644|nr:hypothetical protein [Okeania sp. SIO3I5]NEQ35056.1 hypothetical protein [Okeania sp. SIO3I5]